MRCKLVPPRQSPLRPVTWRSFLRFHPDKDFVDVVMAGLEFGWELPWPAPHSHRLRQLAAARKYARELREIRAKEFALHFRAGPFPSLAEGPELPLANYAPPRLAPRSRDSLTRSDMSSTQLPLDDSSVSATINRKPWSRLQRALSQFWRNKLLPWVALPCSSKIRRRRSRQNVALTSPGVAPPREKDCVNDQTVHSFSTTFSFGARSTLRLSRQRSTIHPAAVRHSSGRPRKIIADDQIAIACALVRPGPKIAPAHEAASLQYLHCSRHTD